ncbi:class I SAM-dependent methyltransferase [Halalkalicoccus jeotgali]|uniref:N-methyltransferase-like protein n=1 Tax=Halalkalicoccus jeotgali (strain DSM 18796 / CECT 7217 / JCM 14584 / KCTC 4019 / B3) TaxID=795797 RepID=D8J8I4_HALJB|nr:class I SAM-dependent methyltransferase [Halalkalicoccus jeotgali]ADJ16230.1 N-methyltransferase-like protein [Halalkalicoccus jeotgali B3]ELY37305.1 N-methyltransferase-like protein [Halalkalicoccus jeotgali B3]
MKGKEWYQTAEVAEEYEDKRFSRGGRLIDRREKEAVSSALGDLEGKKVLEIACGTGRFTAMLAARGAEVVGLDISDAMLSQGREKARVAGLSERVEFVRGDAARLPFPDGHFDAVLAMRFFHLIPNPDRYLREIRRVTDGRLVFDTFNTPSTRSIYNWLLPMGSRLYADEDVHAMLDRTGYKLADSSHDFLLPYGLYRAIPRALADGFYRIESELRATEFLGEFPSVSYWSARVS